MGKKRFTKMKSQTQPRCHKNIPWQNDPSRNLFATCRMDHIPKDPLRHSQVQAIHTWPAMTGGSATSPGVLCFVIWSDTSIFCLSQAWKMWLCLGHFYLCIYIYICLNVFINKTVVWRPSCTCAAKFKVMFPLTSLICSCLFMEAESAIRFRFSHCNCSADTCWHHTSAGWAFSHWIILIEL